MNQEKPVDEDTDKPAGCLGVGVLVALLVPLHFWRAFVASTLWGWFATPLGAPAVGVAHAAGLFALASLLTWYRLGDIRKSEKEDPLRVTVYSSLIPLAALATGALAAWWMPS